MSHLRREIAALDRAVSGARRARRNPDGLRLDFHQGRPAETIRAGGKKLKKLGELRGVVYTTAKGRGPITDYVHGFGRKRPVLALDKAKNLHVVRAGSRYTVTRRGIEG